MRTFTAFATLLSGALAAPAANANFGEARNDDSYGSVVHASPVTFTQTVTEYETKTEHETAYETTTEYQDEPAVTATVTKLSEDTGSSFKSGYYPDDLVSAPTVITEIKAFTVVYEEDFKEKTTTVELVNKWDIENPAISYDSTVWTTMTIYEGEPMYSTTTVYDDETVYTTETASEKEPTHTTETTHEEEPAHTTTTAYEEEHTHTPESFENYPTSKPKPYSLPKISPTIQLDTQPQPPNKLVNTPDGTCGPQRDGISYTCYNNERGSCCSTYGHCGSSSAHCGDGCQSAFGNCGAKSGHKQHNQARDLAEQQHGDEQSRDTYPTTSPPLGNFTSPLTPEEERREIFDILVRVAMLRSPDLIASIQASGLLQEPWLTLLNQLSTVILSQDAVVASALNGTAPMEFQNALAFNGTAPVLNQTASVLNQAAPMEFQNALAFNGTAPVLNQTVPVLNQTAPMEFQNALAFNGTAPVLNGTAPVLNQTAPMEFQNALAFNQTTPVLNQTTPMLNQTAPMQFQNALAFNRTAPVLNQTAPLQFQNALAFNSTRAVEALSNTPIRGPASRTLTHGELKAALESYMDNSYARLESRMVFTTSDTLRSLLELTSKPLETVKIPDTTKDQTAAVDKVLASNANLQPEEIVAVLRLIVAKVQPVFKVLNLPGLDDLERLVTLLNNTKALKPDDLKLVVRNLLGRLKQIYSRLNLFGLDVSKIEMILTPLSSLKREDTEAVLNYSDEDAVENLSEREVYLPLFSKPSWANIYADRMPQSEFFCAAGKTSGGTLTHEDLFAQCRRTKDGPWHPLKSFKQLWEEEQSKKKGGRDVESLENLHVEHPEGPMYYCHHTDVEGRCDWQLVDPQLMERGWASLIQGLFGGSGVITSTYDEDDDDD